MSHHVWGNATPWSPFQKLLHLPPHHTTPPAGTGQLGLLPHPHQLNPVSRHWLQLGCSPLVSAAAGRAEDEDGEEGLRTSHCLAAQRRAARRLSALNPTAYRGSRRPGGAQIGSFTWRGTEETAGRGSGERHRACLWGSPKSRVRKARRKRGEDENTVGVFGRHVGAAGSDGGYEGWGRDRGEWGCRGGWGGTGVMGECSRAGMDGQGAAGCGHDKACGENGAWGWGAVGMGDAMG